MTRTANVPRTADAARSANLAPTAAEQITAGTYELLGVPFRTPIETGDRTWLDHRLGLVALDDGAGRRGLGELPLDDVPAAAAIAGLEARLAELVGRDPAELIEPPSSGRPRGVADSRVDAALGAAALDLVAQRAGLPAWRWLVDQVAPMHAGAAGPNGVRVNALIWGSSTEEVASLAVEAVARGFDCIKVKTRPGETPAELAGRMGAIRSAVGHDVRLRVDANGSWSEADALAHLSALEPLDIEYVEQPLDPALGASALARLRGATGVPIAADESAADLAAVARLVAARAVDAVVLKPARLGGPAAALAAARVAAASGITSVVSTLFESGVGIAAALHVAAAIDSLGTSDHAAAASRVPYGANERQRTAHGLATRALLAADLVTGLAEPQAGRLAIPAGPGLGIALDAAAVEHCRVS